MERFCCAQRSRVSWARTNALALAVIVTSVVVALTFPQTAAGEGRGGGQNASDVLDRYETFVQRACNGIADCTTANIEAEQTNTSRQYNQMARMSLARAVQQLGSPTFVLRSGDKVGLPEYQENPTELKFAEAIVGWANDHCSPNELHVRKEVGQLIVSPMPGGTFCAKGGPLTHCLEISFPVSAVEKETLYAGWPAS